ncbi:MAG: hypothetical protein D6739_06910 [Nitrospirae bacterium]|nr:MAG: hypothetical protein D6739_06910 [Nitrospirota bacterium]
MARHLLVLAFLLVLTAPGAVAGPLHPTRTTGHGPMCGAACRRGDGLGHADPRAVEYGSRPAGAPVSDGLRADRCRMPCRYTRSCCFHRVRTAKR